MSTQEIAHLLKTNNLIKSKILFSCIAEFLELWNITLKSGEYEIKYKNVFQILKMLIIGQSRVHKITIPEGYTTNQIANLLSKQKLINKEVFIKLAKDNIFCNELNIPVNQLEGYLFPDTYFFIPNITEKEIVKIMVNRFKKVMKNEYINRAKELNLSIHEIITLASLIEKEAKVEEERFLISAVFHNRLKKNLRLCSCASVRYSLLKFKEPLTLEDLKVNSKYNTYKYIGLPPSPIANPGKKSIYAALYPAKSNFLYFVSKNDGTHKFSITLKEHIIAKHKYRNDNGI